MSLLCAYVNNPSTSIFIIIIVIYIIVDYLYRNEADSAEVSRKKRIVRITTVIGITIIHALIITRYEDACMEKELKEIIQEVKNKIESELKQD